MTRTGGLRLPADQRVPKQVRELIRRLAHENPRWGSVRIVGELRKLGYNISSRTVRRYRRPRWRGPPSQSWRTFLKNHAAHIWATDFFTVQTLTPKTLYVSLFISHDRMISPASNNSLAWSEFFAQPSNMIIARTAPR